MRSIEKALEYFILQPSRNVVFAVASGNVGIVGDIIVVSRFRSFWHERCGERTVSFIFVYDFGNDHGQGIHQIHKLLASEIHDLHNDLFIATQGKLDSSILDVVANAHERHIVWLSRAHPKALRLFP